MIKKEGSVQGNQGPFIKLIRKTILMKQGQIRSDMETRRYNRQGGILNVALTWSVWRDENGYLAGSVVVLRDVTEHNKDNDPTGAGPQGESGRHPGRRSRPRFQQCSASHLERCAVAHDARRPGWRHPGYPGRYLQSGSAGGRDDPAALDHQPQAGGQTGAGSWSASSTKL
ncbi:hypothetical protein DFAR_1510006 [Desulfarculales bacterium]